MSVAIQKFIFWPSKGRMGLFILTEDDIVFVCFVVRFGTFVQSRLKRNSAAF